MNKNALIIFVRNAQLGKVKTRLAKTIGDVAALEIYKLLLQRTFEVTKPLTCDKIVYYSEAIEETAIWDASYQKKVQKGKDLGEKMDNAFKDTFSDEYTKIIIIGSDVYDLKTTLIEEAFKKMDTYDIVLGPAKDGGYYLLGMKTLHCDIFKEKAWGTATVLAATINDLKKVTLYLLEALDDIDTYKDIATVAAFQCYLKHNS
jgi:uncharacterized protein